MIEIAIFLADISEIADISTFFTMDGKIEKSYVCMSQGSRSWAEAGERIEATNRGLSGAPNAWRAPMWFFILPKSEGSQDSEQKSEIFSQIHATQPKKTLSLFKTKLAKSTLLFRHYHLQSKSVNNFLCEFT